MSGYDPDHDYSYDDPSSPYFDPPSSSSDYLYDGLYDGSARRPLDRLTHLVLVDGRLVETWSEPVRGTRWQSHADRFDQEGRRPPPGPPPPPPAPPYDVVLEWLCEVCGSDRDLAELGTDPLPGVPSIVPSIASDALPLPARHRLESVSELLETAGELCFDAETDRALAQALRLLWEADPDTVLRAKSAAHSAAGLCWAVGRANGLFGPQGLTTQKQVQEALALPSSLSGPGASVQRALRGFSPFAAHRPAVVPDLLPLGHVSLLLASTRRQLVRLRDRAVAAKEAATPTDALLP